MEKENENEKFYLLLDERDEGHNEFEVSEEAAELYEKRTGKECTMERDDPELIKIYREIGEDINPEYLDLHLYSIPKMFENYYKVYRPMNPRADNGECDLEENIKLDVKSLVLDLLLDTKITSLKQALDLQKQCKNILKKYSKSNQSKYIIKEDK
jgi:hypothetical protein